MVTEFMEFGWPIGHEGGSLPPSSKVRNHTGARDFPDQFNGYLKKELEKGAVLGRLHSNPFAGPYVISPLNTVPKRDSPERRVILDLSFPEGEGVNAGIPGILI